MIYLYIFLTFLFGYYIGRKSAINKFFISESEAFNKLDKEMDKDLTEMKKMEKLRDELKNKKL